MTLAKFRATTAHLDPATEILILDLCGLVSPMELLDPAELVDDDPALEAVLATGCALILTSNPL